jgi:hypothetical protein
MKEKRIMPYQRLENRFYAFIQAVRHPRTVALWHYLQEDIKAEQAWTMRNLQERVIAADQLGYDVILESRDTGLHVFYRKRVEIPFI